MQSPVGAQQLLNGRNQEGQRLAAARFRCAEHIFALGNQEILLNKLTVSSPQKNLQQRRNALGLDVGHPGKAHALLDGLQGGGRHATSQRAELHVRQDGGGRSDVGCFCDFFWWSRFL
jgi:hypothetical protein